MTALHDDYGVATMIFTVTGDAEPMVFTSAYYCYVGGVTVTAPAAAALWQAAFTAAGRPAAAATMPAGWVFKGVKTRQRDHAGVETEGEALVDVVGTATATMLMPINVAMLVKKLTGVAGRANKGRMFVPPWELSGGAADANGVIKATSLPTIQARWTAAHAALAASTAPPALTHGVTTAADRLVTSWVVDQRLSTQRRRVRS